MTDKEKQEINEQINYKMDPQELLKPENLGGDFTSTDDLMEWLEN